MNYPNADSYSSRSNFPPIGACGGQAVVLPLLTGLRYTLILQDTELLRKVKNNVTWERLEPVHKSALTENANWDAAPKSTTLPTRPRRTAARHGCSGRVYVVCTLGYTCTNSCVRPLLHWPGIYPEIPGYTPVQWSNGRPKAVSAQCCVGLKVRSGPYSYCAQLCLLIVKNSTGALYCI